MWQEDDHLIEKQASNDKKLICSKTCRSLLEGLRIETYNTNQVEQAVRDLGEAWQARRYNELIGIDVALEAAACTDMDIVLRILPIIKALFEADWVGVLQHGQSMLCMTIVNTLMLSQTSTSTEVQQNAQSIVNDVMKLLQDACNKEWWWALNGISHTLNQIILSEVSLPEQIEMAEMACELIKQLIKNERPNPLQRLLKPICAPIINALNKNNPRPKLALMMLALAHNLADKGWWWAVGSVDSILVPAIESGDWDVIHSALDLVDKAIKEGQAESFENSADSLCYSASIALDKKITLPDGEPLALNIIKKIQEMAGKDWWWALNGISNMLNQIILSEASLPEQEKVVKKACELINQLMDHGQSVPLQCLLKPICAPIINALKKSNPRNPRPELALMILHLAHNLADKGWWWAVGHVDTMLGPVTESGDLGVINSALALVDKAFKKGQAESFENSQDAFCYSVSIALDKKITLPNRKPLALNIIEKMQVMAGKGWWWVLNGISHTLNQIIISEASLSEQKEMVKKTCKLINRLIENEQPDPLQRLLKPICAPIINALNKNNPRPKLALMMLELAHNLADKGWWWAIGHVNTMLGPVTESGDLGVINSALALVDKAFKKGQAESFENSQDAFCYPVSIALNKKITLPNREPLALNIIEKMQVMAGKGWWWVLNGISHTLNQIIISEASLSEQKEMVKKTCKLINRLIENEQSDPLQGNRESICPICATIINALKKENRRPELALMMLELAHNLADKGWWRAIGYVNAMFGPVTESGDLGVINSALALVDKAIKEGQEKSFENSQDALCYSAWIALNKKITLPNGEPLALNIIEKLHKMAGKGWWWALNGADKVITKARSVKADDVFWTALDAVIIAAKYNKDAGLIAARFTQAMDPQKRLIDGIIKHRQIIMVAMLDLCDLSPKCNRQLIAMMSTSNEDFPAARQALIKHSDELLLPILQFIDRQCCDDRSVALSSGLLNDDRIRSLIERYIDCGRLTKDGVVEEKMQQIMSRQPKNDIPKNEKKALNSFSHLMDSSEYSEEEVDKLDMKPLERAGLEATAEMEDGTSTEVEISTSVEVRTVEGDDAPKASQPSLTMELLEDESEEEDRICCLLL